MFEVYSQKAPRVDDGELITEPTMTDQLADEPLDRLVQRYMLSGGKLVFGSADLETNNETTDEAVDAAFDDLATEDVVAMDRDEQLEVLRVANEASAVLAKIAAKRKTEPSTAEGAVESKAASKDADGFKESKE